MDPTLATLLHPTRTCVGLRAEGKADVLRELVALAATSEAVADPGQLLEAVEAREALISTGVGEGLAFPHARTPAVSHTVIAFATLAEPVDFDSLDGEPVRLVLLIAGAESERRDHIRLLSRVSRVLSNRGTRERVLAAGTATEVLAALTEAEAALV